jgi:hypothetical protein
LAIRAYFLAAVKGTGKSQPKTKQGQSLRGDVVIAYFVYNKKDQSDTIVIPDLDCSVPVDANRLQAFIAVSPNFAEWSGEACGLRSAEDFGTILASRDDCGDVSVINEKLWRERMALYLGA